MNGFALFVTCQKCGFFGRFEEFPVGPTHRCSWWRRALHRIKVRWGRLPRLYHHVRPWSPTTVDRASIFSTMFDRIKGRGFFVGASVGPIVLRVGCFREGPCRLEILLYQVGKPEETEWGRRVLTKRSLVKLRLPLQDSEGAAGGRQP